MNVMRSTLTIGRIAGIPIGVNWSWLLVFVLMVWTLAGTVFPQTDPGLSDTSYAAMAGAAAVLFFVSLLLHELGHALQAKRDGMEIDGITLWLFGGVAKFRGMFPTAGAELRIALAGPIVSAVLAAAFIGIAAAVREPDQLDGVAAWLGYINFFLLAFNMLPALPLDGGRVFRALVWKYRGDFAFATRIASAVGRAFAFVMIGGGLALLFGTQSWSGAWLAFLGWFLLQAATGEAHVLAVRESLRGVRVVDVMTSSPVTVPPDLSLEQFVDGVAFAHRYTSYPVVEDGKAIGLLPFSRVASVPRADWGRVSVRDRMLPRQDVPVVHTGDELLDAVASVRANGVNRALVLDGERLVGLLSMTDVARLIAYRAALRR
jgi:Zn-dependent protease/predicted transcriptional regulator